MIRKILLPLCLTLFVMCEKDDPPAPVVTTCEPIATALQIVYPKGGETFTDTSVVTIKWKATLNKISSGSVVLQVSINNGKTWKFIKDGGIPVPDGDVACMEYTWKIGSEHETVAYTSTQSVSIRVGNYGNETETNAESAAFTVTK